MDGDIASTIAGLETLFSSNPKREDMFKYKSGMEELLTGLGFELMVLDNKKYYIAASHDGTKSYIVDIVPASARIWSYLNSAVPTEEAQGDDLRAQVFNKGTSLLKEHPAIGYALFGGVLGTILSLCASHVFGYQYLCGITTAFTAVFAGIGGYIGSLSKGEESAKLDRTNFLRSIVNEQNPIDTDIFRFIRYVAGVPYKANEQKLD
jgi:hypothetical protein